MPRLAPGSACPPIDTTSLRGERVRIPDATDARLVHLQFRRYTGCPICNLHLRSVARRIDELAPAGVREVAVFHSEAAEMLPYQGELPFDVIADPAKELYVAYGVEASLRSILDPRAWASGVKASVSVRWNPMRHKGGRYGLPAEFLIAPTGAIVAAHYGAHADDQWSVDQVLALARARQHAPADAVNSLSF